MKAVILAGGFGTRISEETHLKPKPMIEIGGMPMLWHIMKIYSSHGINDFIICCGYKGYLIKEYFTNYFLHMSDVTLDIRKNTMRVHKKHVEKWKITLIDTGLNTQTGGRLKRISKYLKNEKNFCFTYGDGLSDINISQSRITFLHPEKTFRIGEINIIPFSAAHYNLIDDFGRPDCLSILIQWKGINLFFWGDGIIYEGQYELLSKYNFEYFFAPINGRDKKRENEGIVGNTKENELAEFCSKLSIKHIIPNHYDMFINNTGSIDLFKKELNIRIPNQSIITMNCGDKISNIRGYET